MTPARQALERARSLAAIHRHAEALEALGQARVAEETAFEAHGVAASCHLALGSPKKAIAEAEQAIAIDPNEEWPFRLLAIASQHLGLRRPAYHYAQEAARLRPSSVEVLHVLALTQLGVGKVKAAAQTAAAAVAANPDNALAHETVAIVATKRRDWATAERAYRVALQINPDDPDAALGLGNVLKRRGRRPEASAAYLAAARTNPGDRRARRGLTRAGLPRGGLELMLIAFIFIFAPHLAPTFHTPVTVAALAAAMIIIVVVGTTALRRSAISQLPDDARRGVMIGHRRYALRWLAVSGLTAILLAVWSASTPAKDGGGLIAATILLAYGILATLIWNRKSKPSLPRPVSRARALMQARKEPDDDSRELHAFGQDDLRPAPLIERLHAAGIDTLFAVFILVFAAFGTMAISAAIGLRRDGPNQGAYTALMFGLWLAAMWLFFALHESHSGATPGKRARGLIVLDQRGNRISFTRATARFATAAVGIVLAGVGVAVIPFTRRRLAIHDFVTRTSVMQNPTPHNAMARTRHARTTS